MKPTFPGSWFDLCVVSKHDGWSGRSNAFEIRGVLNAVQPSDAHDSRRGLILMGGPSKHATWANDSIANQVSRIANAQPGVQWKLTTSRRTPPDFLRNIGAPPANLTLVPVEQTDADWVASHLAESAQVWVSPDSVSMVYEALTSGAAVGLLDLALHPRSKLIAGLRGLVEEKTVTAFEKHRIEDPLPPARERLDEASRCARWLLAHWFPK